MNDRKTVIALIIITVVSFAIGGAILINLYKTHEIYEEKTIGIEDITDLQIRARRNADVNIIPSKSDDIRAILHGTLKSSIKGNAAKLEMTRTGQNMSIETEYPHITFSFEEKENISLDIYIPENYENNLVFHSGSGNAKIRDMNLKSMEFITDSGNLSTENVSSELKFTSGSGGMISNRNRGNVNANTKSGNIIIAYSKFEDLLEAKTISGNMILGFSDESCFDLDYQTESGKLNTDLPLKIYSISNNPDEMLHGMYCTGTDAKSAGKIRFSTVSGDLDIRNSTVFKDMELTEKNSEKNFMGFRIQKTNESMGITWMNPWD